MQFPERILASGPDEIRLPLQRTLDGLQRVEWIQGLAPWTVMATLTFRWESSVVSAARVFERWMRRRMPGVSYYEALESNAGRDGWHIHSLWADCETVRRSDQWADWFKRYGRNRIEPARCRADVAAYAAKYLTKSDGWWNVKLQWHHQERIKGLDYALR